MTLIMYRPFFVSTCIKADLLCPFRERFVIHVVQVRSLYRASPYFLDYEQHVYTSTYNLIVHSTLTIIAEIHFGIQYTHTNLVPRYLNTR